ncbi:MAG TPA: aromatic amino acid lyase, partial [Candidatus Angelobacter sp.]|nr:aromatic amino acid lyase [Candidatus Angelobacter sp.]
MSPLEINGNDLSFDELRQVVYEGREVTLAAAARSKVAAAREIVDKLLRENRVAYAINTGVGKLSDVH